MYSQWVLNASVLSHTSSVCDFVGVVGVWYGGLKTTSLFADYVVLLATSGFDLQYTRKQSEAKCKRVE